MEEHRSIQSHRDLIVWQRGMELVEQVYNLSKSFPGDERFGLASQLRRAAVSVPANIAEGNARDSTKEYLHFLAIAVGSLAEVETYLDLVIRLGYGGREQVASIDSVLAEERRMLRGLQRSLRGKLCPPNSPTSDL
jgi:four helix bundle protein